MSEELGKSTEVFKIFTNPKTGHSDMDSGPHPDALTEWEIVPDGDEGIADILDTGKRELSDEGLAALFGLELDDDNPPSDAEMEKLRKISMSVGIDPDFLPPEIIDVAPKGWYNLNLEDVGDPDENGDWNYFKDGIFPAVTDEQKAKMNEHTKEIKKHINADKNASWRDDTCGGF